MTPSTSPSTESLGTPTVIDADADDNEDDTAEQERP
jgi:hypothetical protein